MTSLITEVNLYTFYQKWKLFIFLINFFFLQWILYYSNNINLQNKTNVILIPLSQLLFFSLSEMQGGRSDY